MVFGFFFSFFFSLVLTPFVYSQISSSSSRHIIIIIDHVLRTSAKLSIDFSDHFSHRVWVCSQQHERHMDVFVFFVQDEGVFFFDEKTDAKKNHHRKRGESDGVERVEKSQHGTTSSGVPVPGNRENPQRALGKEPRREDYQLRDRRYDGTVLRAKNDDQKRSFFFRCCLSILSFRLRVAKSV